MFRGRSLLQLSAVIAIAVVLAACGASRSYRKAASASRAGDWDTAVEYYRQAVQQEPNRPDYKIALERAMLSASAQHLDNARLAEARLQLDEALREYRRASEFDPPNRQLATKVTELERRIRDQNEAANRANSPGQQLREAARRAGPQPLFNLKTILPAIRLSDTSVKTIINAIGQAGGINVQFDNAVADRPASVNLENVTLEDALNQVLLTNQLFFKVLNPRTILVAPDTLQKRQQYEDQVIRTFYIENADATELSQIVNQIVRIGNQQVVPMVTPNKSANSITIRGSEALVDIAEKVIDANDNPRAEILVDVQVLEVNRRRAKQFGLDLGNYAINAAFSPEVDPRGTGAATTNPAGGAAAASSSTDLTSRPFNLNTITRGVSTADFYAAVPSAVVRFLASDSETKVIAKPQLRGAEGATLTLNLGEKIPVPSTTFTPLATGGANFNPLTSYQYQDVGVNLEMKPRVTINGDIILDLTVDNSALGANIVVAGQSLPSFTQRKVKTTLRLHDGESNLLAGLLSETDRKSMTGFPGLLHLPILSQLFASNDREVDQTDIVMLLTPHIVRTQELTAQDLSPIYVGTYNNMSINGAPPLIVAPEPDNANAAAPAAGAPAAAGAAAPTTPGAAVSIAPPGSGPVPGTTTLQPAPAAGAATSSGAAPPTLPQAPGTQPATPQAASAPAATPPAAAAPAGGQVLISPPGNEFRAGGGPYTVPLSIQNASRLSSISLTITYNPAALRLRMVQEGSFMRTGGVNATFTQQADASSGRIDIAIVRTGDSTGVTGTGLLAALLFDATTPGTANFTVTGTATTPGGTPVTLQFGPAATVTVR
ncbi:MAG TPA: secretin N-terminal domain-containing protein [Vicinamibacterales bacterium]|jgi:general secretion pathway protein D|nr:secretin N-terminal domain-containing protein [Vicinamibacterales bacterium]